MCRACAVGGLIEQFAEFLSGKSLGRLPALGDFPEGC